MMKRLQMVLETVHHRIRRRTVGRIAPMVGVAILLVVCLPQRPCAEFYRYVNKDGQMVFVDDKSKIPPEYREDQALKTYKEKYDNLTPEQRSIMMQQDRLQEEAARMRAIETEAFLRERRTTQPQQTPVVIEGNKVLVPVILGYGSFETEAMLVLDTGATIIALHREVADQLYIRDFRKAKLRVVGGATIDTDVVRLTYVRVGPHTKQNLHAGVIDYDGKPVSHHGLLGMNFLRGLEYSIDFENQVIQWGS